MQRRLPPAPTTSRPWTQSLPPPLPPVLGAGTPHHHRRQPGGGCEPSYFQQHLGSCRLTREWAVSGFSKAAAFQEGRHRVVGGGGSVSRGNGRDVSVPGGQAAREQSVSGASLSVPVETSKKGAWAPCSPGAPDWELERQAPISGLPTHALCPAPVLVGLQPWDLLRVDGALWAEG